MQIKYKNKISVYFILFIFFYRKCTQKEKNEMAPHRPNQQTAKNN